jgi:hypothetical protein
VDVHRHPHPPRHHPRHRPAHRAQQHQEVAGHGDQVAERLVDTG